MPVQNTPLSDAKFMLEAARAHIRDADHALHDFNKSHPYEIIEKLDPATDETIVCVSMKSDIPSKIKILTRDAADKLYTCLNFLIFQLAVENGKSNSGIQFLATKSKSSFELAMAGEKMKDISTKAKNFINELEPYMGGKGEMLYILKSLRNPGSHRRLVAIGRDHHLSGSFQAGPNGSIAVKSLSWQSLEKDVEILRMSGSGNRYQIDLAIRLSFIEFENIKHEPILPLLAKFANQVEDIIVEAEKRFFN